MMVWIMFTDSVVSNQKTRWSRQAYVAR